jgi:hypothetical protein
LAGSIIGYLDKMQREIVMTDLAARICEAGRIMFSKRLTDLAGGNTRAMPGSASTGI